MLTLKGGEAAIDLGTCRRGTYVSRARLPLRDAFEFNGLSITVEVLGALCKGLPQAQDDVQRDGALELIHQALEKR